jgi:hypothetical protein
MCELIRVSGREEQAARVIHIIRTVMAQIVGWAKLEPTKEQVLQLWNPTPNVTLM